MFHPVRAAHASVFLRYNCFSFADCNVSPRFPPWGYSNEPLNQLATCNIAKIVALVAVHYACIEQFNTLERRKKTIFISKVDNK